MVYLYAIWGCFIAFAVTGLSRLFVVRRLRKEMGMPPSPTRGGASADELNFFALLKEHQSRFPNSSTRRLSNTLIVVQMVAAAAGAVIIAVAQFQPHSLFHLISVAR
jgi:hypothetical protein